MDAPKAHGGPVKAPLYRITRATLVPGSRFIRRAHEALIYDIERGFACALYAFNERASVNFRSTAIKGRAIPNYGRGLCL